MKKRVCRWIIIISIVGICTLSGCQSANEQKEVGASESIEKQSDEQGKTNAQINVSEESNKAEIQSNDSEEGNKKTEIVGEWSAWTTEPITASESESQRIEVETRVTQNVRYRYHVYHIFPEYQNKGYGVAFTKNRTSAEAAGPEGEAFEEVVQYSDTYQGEEWQRYDFGGNPKYAYQGEEVIEGEVTQYRSRVITYGTQQENVKYRYHVYHLTDVTDGILYTTDLTVAEKYGYDIEDIVYSDSFLGTTIYGHDLPNSAYSEARYAYVGEAE